jgi:Cu-processing system permease protein
VTQVFVILLNTYREAVRARILHGLFALAVATALYAVVIGQYATKNTLRVISDIGAFGVSSYGVLVAIVLGASSLYRELEHKTIYPMLARPIARGQYLVGKVLGTWLVILVFILGNSAVLLFALHASSGGSEWVSLGVAVASALGFTIAARRWPSVATYLPIGWGAALVAVGWVLAREAPDDRRVVLVSACLAALEVGIIAAIATLFSSFSSPFLTAIFTFGVFLVGRSADTLAKLPPKIFGEGVHDLGVGLAKVFPNLMVYVPPRPLLTGEAANVNFAQYMTFAGFQTAAWMCGLLALSSLIFKQRDFV